MRELHDSLERAALDAPVLVVLDDFQWPTPPPPRPPASWCAARPPTRCCG
ncbi:hypothetical protein APASM_2697 [Actinosynnema pretiosum subsp. pretiosum]|nr:hypothetical protein APASM_2697 [Actinosynnema pretiosum subsp. pretiosum]